MHFERILLLKPSSLHEIFLDEKDNGRISISASGSGLKTVLIVLTLLHIWPHRQNWNKAECAFAFEELENNMHPNMERRLLLHLKSYAREHGAIFFLSTHSHNAIDLFGTDKDAQIVHVVHDGKQARVRQAITYRDFVGILDDLDVRPSDLLQSNCVIWVEGVTDRLYLNTWIKLLSDNTLVDGVHYQILFYGGALHAHLTADDPTDPDEAVKNFVQLLRVNRRAVMVMDSDKKTEDTPLSTSKKRLITELNAGGGMSWITAGRDIENYLSQDLLQRAMINEATVVPEIKPYDDVMATLVTATRHGDKGKSGDSGKLKLAEAVCAKTTLADLDTMDLRTKLQELLQLIRRWNKMPEGAESPATPSEAESTGSPPSDLE